MKLSPICIVLAAALLPAPAVIAQDKTQTQAQQTVRDRDIYGYQMMTPQERDEFRAKMRSAQTAQERERIRTEHHALMQERAKERGMTMPGMGPSGGMGPGGGMGSGGGMGPGGGMGRGK